MFFFPCSDKPSVKWCHRDSSPCSVLIWQIKSCCWQVYRHLYLGKCTHSLWMSKYFPSEKNVTFIYGWSGVSEITPVAILLLPVTSSAVSLPRTVSLCPTAPQRHKTISSNFNIIHSTVKRQKRLKLSGCIRNKRTDDASPGVCGLTDQVVFVHDGNSQQQLIPSRHEDTRLTGWRRVQHVKDFPEKVQLGATSNQHQITVFASMKITFLAQ